MPRSGSRVRVSFPAPVSKSPDAFGALFLRCLHRFQVAKAHRIQSKGWLGRYSQTSRFCYDSQLRCGNSSVGRARPCQGRGREFESRFPLQFQQSLGSPGFCFLEATCDHGDRLATRNGLVAEWSCSGLQSRVRRFDSDLGLHCVLSASSTENPPACGFFYCPRFVSNGDILAQA